jgi:hypothetical protein
MISVYNWTQDVERRVSTLTLTTEATLLIGAVAVGLSILLIILVGKRKESGYKPDAKDNDGDGIVQEGTRWERPAGTVKIIPAKEKAPVKKAAAKKAPAKKAAPKKK